MVTSGDSLYYLGAMSRSDAGFEKSENCKGVRDYWIVKMDSARNIRWDKTFGASGEEQLQVMKLTSDGNLLAGGFTPSGMEFDKSQPSNGGKDFWLIKINPANGNKIWDKAFGSAGDDELYDILETNDGYILCGNSNGGISGDKTETSWGMRDFLLVKIDFNGNKIWDKTFGSAVDERNPIITLTPDNQLLIVGWSNGLISGDKSQDTWGDYDYWVIKTKDSPFALENNIFLESSPWKKGIDLRWQTTFPPTENVCFYVQRCKDFNNWQTVDSLCRLVGSYRERTFFYFPDFQPQDGINYYRIVMVSDVGVITSNVVSERWILPNSSPQIYPNPFENELIIEWAGFRPDNAYTLNLFDTKGILVYESHLLPNHENKLVYDLQHLHAGNYNGILHYGGRKWNIRAVKQ